MTANEILASSCGTKDPAPACGYSGGDFYAPDPQCWKQ